MTYPELSANASQGLGEIFTYTNNVTGGVFSKMVLFGIFIVIALGTYFSAKRTSGKGDLPVSFAVAGFITSGSAIMMLAIDGFVSVTTVLITIFATGLFVLWMMTSKASN